MKLALTALFFVPLLLQAHVLEIGSAVGVTMHIDPEDDPIAKSPSTIYLVLKSGDPDFNLFSCDCSLTIEQTKIAFSDSTASTYLNPETVAIRYTFPERGVYRLIVSGPTFSVPFDVRVEREATASEIPAPLSPLRAHLGHLILSGAALFFVLGYVIYDKFWKRNSIEP